MSVIDFLIRYGFVPKMHLTALNLVRINAFSFGKIDVKYDIVESTVEEALQELHIQIIKQKS